MVDRSIGFASGAKCKSSRLHASAYSGHNIASLPICVALSDRQVVARLGTILASWLARET